ncbi:MAG: fimbrillin family protein [Prevotella sp.]|nr:fimbrillin family protein [Prevotella sp.]
MKQFKSYSGMAAVCAMLTFASCGNDIELTEAQAPVKGEYKVTFTASQESNATRTALNGTDVEWQAGDAITVFDGAGANRTFEFARYAVIDEQEVKTVGEFAGTITVTTPKSYCSVYPAIESATIDSDYGISGLSLPVEQVATPNGFDPRAAIMTARNDNADNITSTKEDLSLGEFKHVCAFVKVTTTEAYDKITFTANGGEGIAGGFTVTLDENGISTVTPAADASTTVSLVPAIEGTKIAAGTYFIAILPGTLEEGFTMSCSSIDSENKEVTTMVRSYNGTTSAFSRHNVVNMGTVEETQTHVTWVRSTHDYVDLGLTSGTKWATCNVGATTPEGYGDYFAWGEISPKADYSWETYKWCNGSGTSLTKYNTSSEYGPVIDNKSTLDASDDAAHMNWHGAWRMPTGDEIYELLIGCYWEWTEDYNNTGVKGYIVYKVEDANNDDKGKQKTANNNYTPIGSYNIANTAHIFLPVAGSHVDMDFDYYVGLRGNYWSTTLEDTEPTLVLDVLLFDSDYAKWNSDYSRFKGLSVRAVLP